MNKDTYYFLLDDRIQKIQSINDKYDLNTNAYLSFSGGLDSTVLHYLIDMALPENTIPRVFVNTGIEYKAIVLFVKRLAENDSRIQIINPSRNIKKMLEEVGYPFKSKIHAKNVGTYQRSGMTKVNQMYLFPEGNTMFRCPNKLRYQFTDDFKLKLSNKCCDELKKKPFKNYEKVNKKSISLAGIRNEEGGARSRLNCIITDKDNNVKKFYPLAVCDDEFMQEFISHEKIEICELYKEPYNFNRTGCKGCPFSLDLQHQLDVMKELLPNEAKQCEVIWKPVYEEYRRLGYRLNKKDDQPTLF